MFLDDRWEDSTLNLKGRKRFQNLIYCKFIRKCKSLSAIWSFKVEEIF